jgi:hypothetical protein
LLFLFGFFLLLILTFQFFILVIFHIKVTKTIWLSLIHSLAVFQICELLELWNWCLSAWDSILFRKIIIILIIKIRNNRICTIFFIIRKIVLILKIKNLLFLNYYRVSWKKLIWRFLFILFWILYWFTW